MKKDAPRNVASDIALAVVNESDEVVEDIWNLYLLNLKQVAIDTVIIASKGFGYYEGKNVKTSVLRHKVDHLDPQKFIKIESIPTNLVGLTNEYWVSFFQENKLFEKKYVFLPETIIKDNFSQVPLINKPGVMIK